MNLYLYIPTFPASPKKTADKTNTKVGDNIKWSITRDMPILYTDTLAYLTKTIISDTLDSRLSYVSAKVYYDKTDVTNLGTLNVSGQTVTWTANSAFLGNSTYYTGKVLKMELVTQVNGTGSITNSAFVNYYNDSATQRETTKSDGTINYYRDYLAGDTDSVYTDKTDNTKTGYQVNTNATKAAQRSDCAGLTDWYTDPECTQKYTGDWIPSKENNYTLDLYCKNKVTLGYGITSDSYMKTHPNKTIFTDSLMTSTVIDYSKVLPETKTYYYGDTVDFTKLSDLYYKHAGSSHLLACSDGIYAYEDGTGDIFTQVRLTCNSTAYYKWKGGNYDGVLTTS